MCFERLHDGELCIVLESGWLVPEDLLQDTQSQGPDGVLCGGRVRTGGLVND